MATQKEAFRCAAHEDFVKTMAQVDATTMATFLAVQRLEQRVALIDDRQFKGNAKLGQLSGIWMAVAKMTAMALIAAGVALGTVKLLM